MSKIKILVAPGDRAGSGKFRCVDPHVNLQNKFPDDFFIEINHQIDFNDIENKKNNFVKEYKEKLLDIIQKTSYNSLDTKEK